MLVIPLVCLSMRMKFQFYQPNKHILATIQNCLKSNLPINELRQIRKKILIDLYLHSQNINAIKNKFNSLIELVKENVDILLTSEIKIDSSFPTAQFLVNGFTTYRRHRNRNGTGMLLYIKEDIPSNLLHTDDIIQMIYIEISIRKKKWLLGC